MTAPFSPQVIRLSGEFPRDGTPAEKLALAVRHAIRAPSGHNTQPWLFRISGDALVELQADRSRTLHVVDPDDRELVMSCGVALHHLCVALRHYGECPAVELLPDGPGSDLMARVALGGSSPASYAENLLFWAIAVRRTDCFEFQERPVPADLVVALQEAAAGRGAPLWPVYAAEARLKIGELVAKADRIQGNEPEVRRELSHWIHPNRSHAKDGIRGSALGFGNVASLALPAAVRRFHWGPWRARKDREIAETAPLLAVLWTAGDTVRDRLMAGQALSRVLLRAAQDGIAASFLNQPLQVEELRPAVAKAAAIPGFGQAILRLGYSSTKLPETPRRAAEDVLLPPAMQAGHTHDGRRRRST